MFLGCVIGRRSIPIRLPPSGLAKNIILNTIVLSCGIGNTSAVAILLNRKKKKLPLVIGTMVT
jgi:hypothetical protein